MLKTRKDLSSIFERRDGRVIFTGTKGPLIASVFEKYESKGLLFIDKEVRVVGIMNLNYDGRDFLFSIPGRIVMGPTNIEFRKTPEENFYDFIFETGDMFIKEELMVEESGLPYEIFKMFVFEGLRYPSITINNAPRVLESFHMAGFNVQIPASAKSAMFSELHRSKKEPSVLNRHTDMSEPPLVLGAREIALTASKFITKVTGSYLKQTIEAALVNENKQPSYIENLFRK